jgi:hypothetical protein
MHGAALDVSAALSDPQMQRPEPCDVAFAVSLKLVPQGMLGGAAAGMLSVDGRCKTLDARANGYARSECVGASVLERGHGVRIGVGGVAWWGASSERW